MRPFIFSRILFVFLLLPVLVEAQNSKDSVDARKYLPTMLFGGTCAGSCPEPNFPQRIDFNTTQDANGDSTVNAEDAMENLIRYAIGDSLVDTGRTGLPNRGPNDQRPAVYFHHIEQDSFEVYQYWHYYADNDWVNNHEHDVQYYFVYEQCGVPLYILLSYHNFTDIYKWENVAKEDGHPMFDVEAGSHGYQNSTDHNGVRIRYDGAVHERQGKLITPDSVKVPWLVFSNDPEAANARSYVPEPDTMYKGDPAYPFPNPCEYCDGRASPWLRTAWDSVKMPGTGNCPDPVADFEPFGSGYSYVFLDSSENASAWYWDFGDGTRDTGFYPIHTYDSPGSYKVCLSAVDSCGENADCICRTITVADTATGLPLHDGRKPRRVTVNPNPARSELRVNIQGGQRKIRSIRARSVKGRLLKQVDLEQKGARTYELSLLGLPEGVLFIEFRGNGWSTARKVLHKR